MMTVVAAGLLSVLLAVHLAAAYGPRQAALLAVGLVAGLVL